MKKYITVTGSKVYHIYYEDLSKELWFQNTVCGMPIGLGDTRDYDIPKDKKLCKNCKKVVNKK